MDDVQPDLTPEQQPAPETAAPQAETPTPAAEEIAPPQEPKPEQGKQGGRPQGQQRQGQKFQGPKPPQGQRAERGPRPEGQQGQPARGGENQKREGKGSGDRRPERGDERRGDRPGDRHGDRREGRPGGGRPFDFNPEIELEKLISDSLYLDNQAHAVVARMHDMDSGTKSQLRRLYNAVRRAVRAPENERQHEFVMLRARLAYTIARHSLRSLDALERLLLQVTRRNDARGYERFKDLFEAIVAYNE
jgi:CRISPR type III-A-associated protein Csm2